MVSLHWDHPGHGPQARHVSDAAPRHKTTCLITCSGHMLCTSCRISPCSTTSVPTRGAVRSGHMLCTSCRTSPCSTTSVPTRGAVRSSQLITDCQPRPVLSWPKRASMASGLSLIQAVGAWWMFIIGSQKWKLWWMVMQDDLSYLASKFLRILLSAL